MKITLFLSPSPGWTSLLCPRLLCPIPCGVGDSVHSQCKIISSCCSFLLRFFLCSGISSPLTPVLLWNRFSMWYSSFREYPPGLGPPWHVPFLAPWSTSVSFPCWPLWVFFLLFRTPFVLFYFVMWHFLSFLKYTFPEVFSVVLRGSAMSAHGTAGTSWAWDRAAPRLFPQKLLLQPLCCQHFAGYNQ